MAHVRDITSEADFRTVTTSLAPNALSVIFFHTPWAAPCKQHRTFFETLAAQYEDGIANKKNIAFLAVDAEELPEISEDYDVTAVPFVVLVRAGTVLDSISGSNTARVRDAVEKEAGGSGGGKKLPDKLASAAHAAPLTGSTAATTTTNGATTNGTNGASTSGTKDLSGYTPSASDPKTAPELTSAGPQEEETPEQIQKRCAELVKAAPVMLFMKGTPSSPQCGFSRQTVQILRDNGVRYGFFDILAASEIRQGLKEFSDWPTYPQLWVEGELIGGLDLVREALEEDPNFFAKYSVQR